MAPNHSTLNHPADTLVNLEDTSPESVPESLPESLPEGLPVDPETPKTTRTVHRFRATTTIIIPTIEHQQQATQEQSVPLADSVLDALHEDHKNISPLLCLGLLYVFLTGDTNWLCLSLLQIAVQSLLFSRHTLRNPCARRALLVVCMTMLIVSIVSLSAVRPPKDFRAPIAHQFIVIFFILTAFIGFVLTNLYNISLLFVFGCNVKWLLSGETEEERETA